MAGGDGNAITSGSSYGMLRDGRAPSRSSKRSLRVLITSSALLVALEARPSSGRRTAARHDVDAGGEALLDQRAAMRSASSAVATVDSTTSGPRHSRRRLRQRVPLLLRERHHGQPALAEQRAVREDGQRA